MPVRPLHTPGRVLLPPRLSRWELVEGETIRRPLVRLALVIALPLFAQVFHYMIDLPPLYYLSKALPFIVLPLTVWAAVSLSMPLKPAYALMLAYALGLTPMISMLVLGNGLLDALGTTVKIWPFTYYFAVAALLFSIRPDPQLLRRTLVALGAGTFAILVLLWFGVPRGYYALNPLDSRLFIWEVERGYRIYFPMVFGLLFIFYLNRLFFAVRRWWLPLLVLACFVALLLIYKQRLAIATALLVVGLGVIACIRGRGRLLLVAGVLAATAAGVVMIVAPVVDSVADKLGGSLTVRRGSFAQALDFLEAEPSRWLFGVGAVTRFSRLTFADIFDNPNFYLADLGWIGIVFEYGVVGTALIALIYVASFVVAWRASRSGDPMLGALSDYCLYLLITSLVYSAVYAPGEVATMLALVIYLRRAPHVPTRPAPPPAAARVEHWRPRRP